MTIENANSHPFKVAITKEESGRYANSHPYKVSVVEGGSSVELVSELPEVGENGPTYVLVDDIENPTKVYGEYIYQNGWVLAAQPVDQSVQMVETLPETGQEGVLYYVPKTGTDTHDLYRWINNSWVKVDTDVVLYSQEGNNVDGAMTQAATTAMKGQAKILTTADYNYPTDNPNCVALWLLEPGFYIKGDDDPVIRYGTSYTTYARAFIVCEKFNDYKCALAMRGSINAGTWNLVYYVMHPTGSTPTELSILDKYFIVNNLISTDSGKVLSAAQGKVLADRIGNLSSLQTADKTTIVNAINELVGSGANTINSQDWSDLWQ